MNKLTASPHIIKASLFAIFAFFFMAVFGVLTKVACDHGDPIWVSFITYCMATLVTAVFILPKGMDALKSRRYSFLILRAVSGTVASFLYMLSIRYIPIINSTLLFNTAPIFIPLLAVIVLKAHEEKNIWYAVILGFTGVIVIIKPGLNILTNPGNLIGLLSGFALAIAYLTMKFLTATETGLRIIFYYFAIGSLMQISLLGYVSHAPSTEVFIYAMLCGVAMMAAQMGLVKAYQYATASEVGVYQYTSVVFVAMIEWAVWGRTPSLSDFIGFLLVSAAGIFIIVTSKPAARKSNARAQK